MGEIIKSSNVGKIIHGDKTVIKQTVHRNDYGTEFPFGYWINHEHDPMTVFGIKCAPSEKDITDLVEVVDQKLLTEGRGG